MNKQELVDSIFEELKKAVPKKDINAVVSASFDCILKAISKNDPIKLVGFLNINLKEYGSRKVRNPRTGETYTLGPTVKAVAKLGASFKDATKKIKPGSSAKKKSGK